MEIFIGIGAFVLVVGIVAYRRKRKQRSDRDGGGFKDRNRQRDLR